MCPALLIVCVLYVALSVAVRKWLQSCDLYLQAVTPYRQLGWQVEMLF